MKIISLVMVLNLFFIFQKNTNKFKQKGIHCVHPKQEILSKHRNPNSFQEFYLFYFPKKHKQVWFFWKIKNPQQLLWVSFCGERGIRTPGGVTLAGFQDQCIRPLCHFSNSECKYKTLFCDAQTFFNLFLIKNSRKNQVYLCFSYLHEFLSRNSCFSFGRFYSQIYKYYSWMWLFINTSYTFFKISSLSLI